MFFIFHSETLSSSSLVRIGSTLPGTIRQTESSSQLPMLESQISLSASWSRPLVFAAVRTSAHDSLLLLGKFCDHGQSLVVVDSCSLQSPWRCPGSCPTPCLYRVGMDLCGQRYQHRRQGERRGSLINIMSLVVPINDVKAESSNIYVYILTQ